jgi:hypothetical protein
MQLTELEFQLVSAIIEFNKNRYPDLVQQFHSLKVKSREYTGVGCYINFYLSDLNSMLVLNSINTSLSCNKLLKVNTLINPLSFELDIMRGKINFLEIVTNGGESWDGSYNRFEIIEWGD